MKYFRYALYCIATLMFSLAMAGSFEDFFAAIRNDDAGTLTNLLGRGFDPNTRNPKGQPGLTLAIQQQSPKAEKTLLDQPGTDVNALNEAGESPLMMAALKGNLPAMRRLLERGAQVNQPGWSALHYAATGPDSQCVQLLLDRGADIEAASPNGTTPLMMAAQYGSEASVDLLLKRGADPKKRNQRNLAAADFAKLAGREALVKRLEPAQR